MMKNQPPSSNGGFDRRKKVQWYTFWVAFFCVVVDDSFGTIQCLEGGFQAVKVYHPVESTKLGEKKKKT